MATVKEIRGRIRSIKNTSKITKAMQLISAVKMRRAQEIANSGKPYSQLINEVLRSLAGNIDPNLHPLLIGNEVKKDLVVAISSDRGFAGALTSNLIKKVLEFETGSEFISIGTKAKNFLARTGRNIVADFPLPEHNFLEAVRTVSNFAVEKFLDKQVGRVYVVYTEFHSTLAQEPKVHQLLPIMDLATFESLKNSSEENRSAEYKFEPAADQILDELLPHFVLMELHHSLLEARASEHSARMIAMKAATDNALELVDDLTLTYNQIRQENITKEILDISTAAVALE